MPAMALKRPELGSLKPGSVGDATILTIKEGRFDYVDVVGEHLAGDRKIASKGSWSPGDGGTRNSLTASERNSRSLAYRLLACRLLRTAGNRLVMLPSLDPRGGIQ